MRWNYYKLRQLSLLRSAMDCYYKLRPLFYYKVRHGLLQIATGITKCDGFITNRDRYYKVRWLLQIATVQREQKEKVEGGGGGEKRKRLLANPTILENAPWYFTVRLICKLTARQSRSITNRPGGGTWVFFGWVCAARDSKLAPRSKKNFP